MINDYDNLNLTLSTLPASFKINISEIVACYLETCKSKNIQKIVDKLQKVKKYYSPLMLIGEPGVGKEYFSRLLHFKSNSSGPFLNLNLNEIPVSTYDFMLFGENSVNLPSKDSHIGKILEAQSGTLFINHIDKLSANLQKKFLNTIRTNVVLNSTRNKSVKIINQIKTSLNVTNQSQNYPVRIIVGSDKNLKELVAEGKFRKDLFYRLSVFTIVVPPLRKRQDDIQPLMDFYIKYYSKMLGRPIKKIDPSTLDWVKHYSWPTNIDELMDFVRLNLYYSNGEENKIKLRLLPSKIHQPHEE
jgi:DNA-binding NtrC family response regulator